VAVGSCAHLYTLGAGLLEERDQCVVVLDDEYGYWAAIVVARPDLV
jgi:hypothetical protein